MDGSSLVSPMDQDVNSCFLPFTKSDPSTPPLLLKSKEKTM